MNVNSGFFQSSGVFAFKNAGDIDFKTNQESSLFNKALGEKQNTKGSQACDAQFSQEALNLSNASSLAKGNFEKIQKVLTDLRDSNTGEKVDFNSLSRAQQKDLVDFLGGKLLHHQEVLKNANIRFSNVKITQDEGYVFASTEFIDDKGERVNLAKLEFGDGIEMVSLSGSVVKGDELATWYSQPLGDKKARQDLEVLAMDYVRGEKEGYFAYLKKHSSAEEQKRLAVYENIAKEHLKVEREHGIDMSAKNLNITLPDGRTIIRNKIEPPEPSEEYVLYKKILDELFHSLFGNKTQDIPNQTYIQTKGIKSSVTKPQDEMLKQALNLDKTLAK